MGDLISRKSLMNALRGNVLIDVTSELENTVSEQPAAFDLESVIAELEKKRDFCYAEVEKERNRKSPYTRPLAILKLNTQSTTYNDCLEILKSAVNATNGKIGG